MTALPCPCGSGIGYVRRDARHLLRTWHPSTAPDSVEVDDAVWLGLEVLSARSGGPDDAAGTVTFVAQYQLADGSLVALRETSRFVRERGEWTYVDGETPR